MTRQEIFDKVSEHLLKQNERAVVKGSCKYRTPNGCKCAIGCLIPDEKYWDGMEGIGVLSLVKTLPELLPTDCNSEMGARFLMRIQMIHDDLLPSQWKESLQKLKDNPFLWQ